MAVPVADRQGKVHAAVSISMIARNPALDKILPLLPKLQEAAGEISQKVFPSTANNILGAAS